MDLGIDILEPRFGAKVATLATLDAAPADVGAHGLMKLLEAGKRKAPVGIVLHTTGGGLARKAADSGGPETFDAAAARYYTTGALPYFGHYLVGRHDAGVYQLAHPRLVAFHTGALDSRYGRGKVSPSTRWRRFGRPLGVSGWTPHQRDPAVVYDWWDKRWAQHIASPVELFGRQVNAVTVGIDVVPDVDGSFGDDQVEHTAQLVAALCVRFDIEPTRFNIVRHEDVDPVRRGCVLRQGTIYGVPWDPGPRFPFDGLLERVVELLEEGSW